MSTYGTKYYSEIKDFTGNTFTVELKLSGYTGTSSYVREYAVSPLTLSYKGGREIIDNPINGSELTFSFWVNQNQEYDDLLEAEYRDWQVFVRRGTLTGTTGQTVFVGWVKPENISRRYVSAAYFIHLTCSDGLADLKDIEFPASGTTQFYSYLQLIKVALAQTGLELPIIDQVNIMEEKTTQPLLKGIQANGGRFKSTKNNRTVYLNSYDTLNRLMEPFNLQLIQADGKWVISQKNEVSSLRHSYTWTTLSATTASYNRQRNIDSNYSGFGSDDLSKIRPFKRFELKFQNRNLNGNVFTNGQFNSNINGWNNGTSTEAWPVFTHSDGALLCNVNDVIGDPEDIHSFSSDEFAIEVLSTGDTIVFNVTADLLSLETSSPYHRPPKLKMNLDAPIDGLISGFEQQMIVGSRIYTATFDVNHTGNYTLIVEVVPGDEDYQGYAIAFDNIEGIIQYEEDSDTTFDKIYTAFNENSSAIATGEQTVYFSDAINTSDLGVIKYNATGTTRNWTNYRTGITTFSNSTFSGATISPWEQLINHPVNGSGQGWQYLGGLSNDIQIDSSLVSYSTVIHQGVFAPGFYDIELTGYNHSTVSGGVNPNVWLKAWKLENGSSTWELIDTEEILYHASNLYSAEFNIELSRNARLGFSMERFGPGTELKVSVGNVVCSYEPNYRSLPELYIYNKLTQYQRFKNFIRISLIDYDQIRYYHVLELGGKKYHITGYNYDFKNNILDLELTQFLEDVINLSTLQTINLSTVDGE